ncbi:MAG: molybdate ABC transporter substrate-binding protein [Rhodospirillaceae bacterium]|nr:molybdate ABC transporter substrate-binding protein [Rhodospirillaceae bacterium]
MAVAAAATAHAEAPVRLYAAGSLKAALTEIAAAFRKETGIEVAGTFGPSGLLRDRIARREPAEVFASANMSHPAALAAAGRAGPVQAFALNRLCALVGATVTVTSDTLLQRLLDPAVKLGTSTPKADPSGDYAWRLFEKAEMQVKGAYAALDAKALKLTGGPNAPAPPKDRSLYGKLVEEGAADIFLTYRTNAVQAKREVPALQIVAVPDALAVGAEYGLTVIAGARPEAGHFAAFIRSQAGRAILERFGFGLPPQN